MDYSNRDIIYAIRKIAGVDGIKKAQIVMGTVTRIPSGNDKTVDVDVTLGDACQSITGVNLNTAANDGYTLFPAIESDILIALMPDNSAYMLACEDITKVVCYIDANNKYEFDATGFIWNDGTNDGLVKVIELTQKLNNLENAFNQHLLAYNSHTHVGVTSGFSSTGITTPDTQTLTPTVKTEIENSKIKH
jgi:hypothetical protein